MSESARPRAIFLMGPTAAGKTGLAVNLVEQFPLDIISVDSALVYRHMSIGSAKPDSETLRRAPHRLIDLIDPIEAYSAARFREDALAHMRDISAAGRVPLLVGGTMLYFRALQQGLSKLPAADAQLRSEIESEARDLGWPALHEQLQDHDPVAAAKINPNDPQRIQRALEVFRLTGQPLSELQNVARNPDFDYETLKLVVCPEPRGALHDRIAQRFQVMIGEGFLEEVKALMSMPGLNADLPSMRAVGYRQAWAHLSGELDADEWIERATAATRQLAKRQLTWLRGDPDAVWYDPTEPGAVRALIKSVKSFLNLVV